MAPMTRERAPDGVATSEIAAYYGRRAAGGVGLILTEGTPIDAAGAFSTAVPRFYGDDASRAGHASLRRCMKRVHASCRSSGTSAPPTPR
jgi:2,4-dienoyl-CoA reductase-like NADH-dependent reductase (Old Yellow Enzyme family)